MNSRFKIFSFSPKSIIVVIFIITTLMLGSGVAGSASSGPIPLPITEWTLNVQSPTPSAETFEPGTGPPRDKHITALASKLNYAGLSVSLTPSPGEEKTGRLRLKTAGKHGLDDFRRLLYTVMKPEINLIGGVTEMEIESVDAERQTLDIVLESNPSTGHAWHLLTGGAFIESGSTEYQMHTLGYGVPQRQILHLKRGSNGSGPIRLVHRRRWEETPATLRLTHRLSSLPEKIDLSNPNTPAEPAPPLSQPYVNEAAFPVLGEGKSLPAQWDWRSQGIVTPIRDQAYCGSCWAFGTVGIMESALWKNGIANQNLSEQFLVSCNNDGWSCDGGWTAHKYHYNTLGTNQTTIGAVFEAEKPYTATDGSCNIAYNHPYKLTGWQFVTGSEYTIPTVDQIKNAIYTYGPITAGVCVGDAFQDYQPGMIFSTDETAVCGGYSNHQIILVGWDDPGQYWILRNSWGTSWGESGYMRIKWDTSRVGEGTSWVTTSNGSPIAMPTFSPSSGVYTGSVTVTISCATSGATIRYTTDGTDPTSSSTQYTGPLTFTTTTILKARAFKTGMTDSDVAVATYTIAVSLNTALDNSALTFSTGGDGVWFGQSSVFYYGGSAAQSGFITDDQVSWLQAAVTGPGPLSFYWKVSSETNYDYLRFYIDDVEQNGSISGTVNWQQKTFSIPSGSHTLKWAYTKDESVSSGSDRGWLDKIEFTQPQKVAQPTMSQPTGTYISTVTVSLSSTTSGATIRYTTDGTDPTSSSTQYGSPLTFTTTTTLKARAFKSGMTDSDVASATYTVKVATPSFTQPTGTYIETVTVSMSCTTSGATIRYTTDGTDPTSSSTQYSSPLTFTTTTTLKARAFKTGMADSDVASVTFTVLPTYQVTPSIGFGTGHGTITPDTAQTVPQGSTTSFTVTPDTDYTASVGGTCGGTLVGTTYTTNPVTANCSVIAGFTSTATCQSQPVRIVRTNTSYTTLQEAYDAAVNNDTIQAQALTLIQNLTVNRNIVATLTGGYPCNYGSNTGSLTTLKGWIKTMAGGGTLTIGNFIVMPNVQAPTVTTGSATNVTAISATINGTVRPNSAATTYYFEYGLTTAYGSRNPLTSASAGRGSSDVSVLANLTLLTPNTLYHYRLVAVNSEGTTNGSDGNFTTPCVFTISPTTAIMTSSSHTDNVSVTANSGCSWTAVRNDAWISIDSGASGTESGTVQYSVTANPSKDSRTGTMTIAGQTLTVEQAGAPCSYSLNPTDQSFTAWGGTGGVAVTAVGGCPWAAASNADWITITSGESGTGNGTVNYSVGANSGTSARSGTVAIAGQTFTVNQAAGPLSCGGFPVRNANTFATYATLQEAYNGASDGHTLQVQAITLTGNLTVNHNISITLEGGYDCGFSAYVGTMTKLQGWLKTTSGGGTLTIKNFELDH